MMNKEQYISTLEKELKRIPKQERFEIIEYYEEYLEDVLSDDGTLESLESPVKTAQYIYGNYCIEKSETIQSKPKRGFSLVTSIILLVLAAPIGLPLSIALIALIVALLAIVFSVLLAVFLLIVTLFGGGLISLILALVALFSDFWQAIGVLGLGLAAIGLGIIATIGFKKLFIFVLDKLKYCAQYLSKKVGKNEE